MYPKEPYNNITHTWITKVIKTQTTPLPLFVYPMKAKPKKKCETTKYIKVKKKKKNYRVLGPHEKLNPNIPSQSQWKETSAHVVDLRITYGQRWWNSGP